MSFGSILVTGGAGYIGSHVVKALVERGYPSVVVLDNLSTGFIDAVKGVPLIQGDVQDSTLLDSIFKTYAFDTVMHFAACTVIPESLHNPIKYYQNNTLGTVQLLNACQKYGVKNFIFSSTAAVYGLHSNQNITEEGLTLPIHPYGRSKWMSEEIIKEVGTLHKIRYAILRYFNVAGADPSGALGQKTLNASHLIKVAVETACGKRPHLPIFGSDYPTEDGTCIRDYIHVCDLADAHIRALNYLQNSGESCILNCGYGKGFSVKEVIEAVETVTNKKLPIVHASRREGDLARVVADNTRLSQMLNWQPQYDDLLFIVKTAYQFESQLKVCEIAE